MSAGSARVPFFVLLAASLALPVRAQTQSAPLIGVVVDPDGRPVANALVSVARGPGRGFRCHDLELRDTWIPIAKAKTNHEGRFGVQLPIGLLVRVEVDHAPFAIWRAEDLVPGDDLRIALEAPCTFRGQLTFADHDRAAIGELRGHHRVTRIELFRGRTDAAGRFRFDRLPAGAVLCEVIPDAAECETWTGHLAPAAPTEQVFRLPIGIEVRGTVVDDRTGTPVAGARIGEHEVLRRATVTDAAGRFELRGQHDRDRADLHCEAAGYARFVFDPAVRREQRTIELRLDRGIDVTGRIVDEQGRPRANVYVAAVGDPDSRFHVPWLPARTDAGGDFVCRGLPRPGAGFLLVRCDGFATTVHQLPPPNARSVVLPPIALRPARLVRGTVVDEDGKPVRGAVVSLRGTNADRAALPRAGAPRDLDRLFVCLGERVTRSDANGNFAFGDVPAGEFGIALGDVLDHGEPTVHVTVTANADPKPVDVVRD